MEPSLEALLYHVEEIERWSKGHSIRTPQGGHTAHNVIYRHIDAAKNLIRDHAVLDQHLEHINSQIGNDE